MIIFPCKNKMLSEYRRSCHENADYLSYRMAETIRNRNRLRQNLGKSPLATRFSMSSLWFAAIQLYRDAKALSMLCLQTPGFDTADTIFHATKVPLVKWFWAIYLMASDKGGLSALRLSKHIGISWISARSMLKKIRTAMAHRGSIYRLEKLIEFDDTYVGGKRSGKRGRGAEGKKPVLVAVESREKGAGFVAMEAVDTVSEATIRPFLSFHLKPGQNVRTDAFPALNVVSGEHVHQKKVTPPGKAAEWLPLVHILIGNMKKFLNGTFHGVSSQVS